MWCDCSEDWGERWLYYATCAKVACVNLLVIDRQWQLIGRRREDKDTNDIKAFNAATFTESPEKVPSHKSKYPRSAANGSYRWHLTSQRFNGAGQLISLSVWPHPTPLHSRPLPKCGAHARLRAGAPASTRAPTASRLLQLPGASLVLTFTVPVPVPVPAPRRSSVDVPTM